MKITNLSTLTALVALAATLPAHADFLDVNLSGTTQYDAWSGLTRANYPAYATNSGGTGTLASYTAAWPAPFASNTGASGDAVFNKTSGSGAFAGAGLYQAGGTGVFSVGDTSALPGLGTIVFQLESNYDEASATTPFLNGVVPTLFLNGGSTGIAADYTQYLPDAGLYLATNSIYAYQWDLSSFLDPVTSFSINWNGPASSGQITGMQLDQGSQFAQVVGVPEPSPALFGLAPLGLMLGRRRRTA